MLNFSSLLNPEPTLELACKGRFYRVVKNKFIGKEGSINFSKKYRPLKTISCKGCAYCDSLDYDLRESELNIVDIGSNHGDIVQLIITNLSHDWESGLVDDWDLEFRIVKET